MSCALTKKNARLRWYWLAWNDSGDENLFICLRSDGTIPLRYTVGRRPQFNAPRAPKSLEAFGVPWRFKIRPPHGQPSEGVPQAAQ
jgi:hypothetical protein